LVAIESGCGQSNGGGRFNESTNVDPWLLEDHWFYGTYTPIFSLERESWNPDQKKIYEAIKSTTSELERLVHDEQFLKNTNVSQAACDKMIRDAMHGKPVDLMEKTDPLQLGHVTSRFREQISSESHPLPFGGEHEWYFKEENWDSNTEFTDLLFRCNVGARIYRLSEIDLTGDSANAIVESRCGGIGNDTIIDGKKYGAPHFTKDDCDGCLPVRFDLVKVDGKWLIDHREFLN
jgi:hypothetical protein